MCDGNDGNSCNISTLQMKGLILRETTDSVARHEDPIQKIWSLAKLEQKSMLIRGHWFKILPNSNDMALHNPSTMDVETKIRARTWEVQAYIWIPLACGHFWERENEVLWSLDLWERCKET